MMDFLIEHPLTSLLVTLLSFHIFGIIQKRAGGHALLNPVVWAIVVCVCFIKASGISYEAYMDGAGIIHFLLGPVTVALAVPLYRLSAMIRRDAKAILPAILVGCLVAAFSAMAIVYVMGGAQDMQLAIVSKSVTVPIAIDIAGKIGAAESLAVFFVFSTNIPWIILMGYVFKALSVRDERAQGLALGTTCHGLGVARAFQISEICGTYSVIGMSLMGIISGVILPILILRFFL